MKKRYKIAIGITILLIASYLAGPKPQKPRYTTIEPAVPEPDELEQYIRDMESRLPVKNENEAEIVWADTPGKQTEYALVYLHGFSASKNEGNPVHLNLAKKLNANLYLARLADHGLDIVSPMLNLTADRLWESSKLAYAIGRKLGKKVILMGTSTGATLALKLATVYPEIHSLILISPNIAINDPKAWLLNDHWGLQIAKQVLGGAERIVLNTSAEYKKYWYTNYRLESLVALQELVESSMTRSTFNQVKQPVLLLYFYKNEQEQDPVVRVDAMLKMFDELATPEHLKTAVAIPNGGSHVLGSYLTSKDLPSVEKAIGEFVSGQLKIKM